VIAGEIDGISTPEFTEDMQELAGARIAPDLVQVVAKAALLDVVTSGHDVQQQPSARDALICRGHLSRERRRRQPRTEGDQVWRRPRCRD
jgi:hypothetical protein